MADQLGHTPPQNASRGYWSGLLPIVRKYLVFGILVVSGMAYANHRGWYPTFGIFSGENSMHSSSHHGYYGTYGIHGK